MSASEELRSYVERLRRRLRLVALLRGAAVLTASALVATLVLTAILNRLAFSAASLWSARGVLGLILAAGIALALAVPLWRLTRRWAARRAERAFPDFEQRLLTFTERDRAGDPFLELLAADTLRMASAASPRLVVPDAALTVFAGVAVVCLAALLWLIRFGPGYWGYGAAALWTGPPTSPLYAIRVSPGDAAVRRNGDQLVIAQPRGLQTDRVRMYVRYGDTSRWDHVAMQPQPQGSGFEFLLAGIPQDVEYYVEAGALDSPHYHLRVVDVPSVRRIRVRYRYPAWTKLADAVEEHGGDLRAVTGTQAQLEVRTDRPLRDGVLVLDDGRQIPLVPLAGGAGSAGTGTPPGDTGAGSANAYRAAISIERDGAYHVAARDRGETLRISEDYFIEAGEVRPPEVAIVRPAGDYRASPIEEVTVGARAADAFGLTDFTLHYSVNGGADKTVPLLKDPGAKQASGSTLVSLETLKLVPGDVVSYYATAKDGRAESHTDIAFIQVDPFERDFSQSQQAGGGGGGFGNGQAQIAEREKEIIEETWKQAGLKSGAPEQAAEQAKFLSDVQSTLRSQSLALAGRVALRDLSIGNEAIGSFQQEMSAAAEAMSPAVQSLRGQKWSEAIAPEQKALQHLLRAQATFRQIEVAFGSMGAGSGAVNSAGRDLAGLFDLELDMQKNQYETRPDASSSPSQGTNQVDDALRKLDELAQRQDALAAQRRAGSDQTAEQRWQQEELRRQADQLRRQLEQLAQSERLARNGPSGQSAQAGQDGQDSQSGQDGQSGQSGQSMSGGRLAGASGRIGQALDELRQAEDDMRRAVDQGDDAGARRAAERLREAMQALGGIQQREAQTQLAALRQEADRLTAEERKQAARLQDLASRSPAGLGAFRGGPSDLPPVPGLRGGPGDVQTMIDDRQQLADDLGQLEARMRDAERDTLPRSRAAASKLRDALSDLDESETQTLLQRSADQMRRGYVARADSTEGDIESSLQHLSDQLGQAGTALGQGQPPAQDALDDVERLRDRLAALDPDLRSAAEARQGDRSGQARQPNQPGQAGQGGQPGQAGRAGPVGRAGADGAIVGPVTAGGGGVGGFVNGGWNTGNNGPYSGRAAAPDTTSTPQPIAPQEAEQSYRQGMSELSQLRRAVGNDEERRREVDELIRSMQHLDPRRFPGNPVMVQELYGRVLSDVDRLELQLRRQTGEEQAVDVRSERPQMVPRGYQDAVAEYYRRLSKSP